MLQLTNFYDQCIQKFCKVNHLDLNLPTDIETVKFNTEKLFLEINHKRSSMARNHLSYYIDQLIWTDAEEYIDDPNFNIEIKKKIINGLHKKNVIFGTYNKMVNILEPLINEININEKRPARILELGSGLGKLTFAMFQKMQYSQMQVEITGSDIVPEYVLSAKNDALFKKYMIDFKVINAFNLNQLESQSYDIIFTLHSMHHFSPSQLAVIMSGSMKIAKKAFVGIDAYRGILNLLFMMISGAGASLFHLNLSFFHDSFISGRRMYSAKQLEIIAKLGCPQSFISSENHLPGLTVVKILK